MLIGGMIIQILIQAALLQLSLKLIAKYEADTSFSTAAMVTAGITVGNFLVAIMLARFAPWLIWPAQIALTAAVIMTFCWISFWKSVVVVIVFIIVQTILALIIAMALGVSIMGALTSSALRGETPKVDYKNPVDKHNEEMLRHQELLNREAERMRREAVQRQKRIEAEVHRMETEAATPSPAPTNTPPPPTLQKPVVEKPQRTRTSRSYYQRRRAVRPPEWEPAHESLRMGGIVKSGEEWMAMINGKMITEGDIIRTEYRSREYSWRVKDITQTRVDLEQLEVK